MFPIERSNVIKKDRDTIFFYQEGQKSERFRFSTDISNCIYGGYTVTFINFQIAYYLGFKKVYLIGMDHNYTVPEKEVKISKNKRSAPEVTTLTEDKNHFDPTYFGKGYRWHLPDVERMEFSYHKVKKVFEEDNREVFDATVNGKLNIFKKVDYYSLF